MEAAHISHSLLMIKDLSCSRSSHCSSSHGHQVFFFFLVTDFYGLRRAYDFWRLCFSQAKDQDIACSKMSSEKFGYSVFSNYRPESDR